VADYSKIVMAAMSLRQATPELWDAFVESMRMHGASVLTDTLRAPPELLQRAQGMAIEANEIATVLRTAPEKYEQMQNTILGRGRDGRQEQEWRS
jgi:hypothetical protein